MSQPLQLQSYIGGRFVGARAGAALASAVDGRTVAFAHADELDFGEAVDHARRVGVPALLALDFQQRAARLKALAKFLMERKEALYAISHHTGATRADSWIDIEGGAGTLFAYASMGSNELPSGNLIHEGPAMPLGKKGQFAGTHVLVPRRGVAVHINAFNFPIWGALEKFAPSFLAGMPCIVKPATSTSYLTEAMVRVCVESGLLPEGSLQLVVGATGDLLDRVNGQDIVTFTGSADTAARLRVRPNLIANSVPFNAEADSLNCAVLADDVTPDDVEFDLFVKEVAREMTVKSGQKCTAIRRAIVPRKHLAAVTERLKARLAKVVVGDPSVDGVTMGALAIPSEALAPPSQAALASYRQVLKEHREHLKEEGAGYALRIDSGEPLESMLSGRLALAWANARVVCDSPEKSKVEKGEIIGKLMHRKVGAEVSAVQTELLMVSPYLIPGDDGMKMLDGLHAQGVRIRILTNSLMASNVLPAQAGYMHYRKPLLADGTELYEVRALLGDARGSGQSAAMNQYGNYGLHAKLFVFDRKKLFIGSMNFDQRSMHLNTEVGLIIDSEELARQTAARFEAIVKPANSYQVIQQSDAPGATPHLTWHTEEDGKPVDYSEEPSPSAWRRLKVELLSILPLDREL